MGLLKIFTQNTNNFDATILKAMHASNVPGAAILIIADRQIKYAKGYGLADPQTEHVVTPDTLFTIASISKIVTATALMTLYEQKKFTLDDDINLYWGVTSIGTKSYSKHCYYHSLSIMILI